MNGLTFENENASDLKNQIVLMQENHSCFDSTKIIEDIKGRFNIDNIANQYIQAIDK